MTKKNRRNIGTTKSAEPQSAAINLRVLGALSLFASKEDTKYMLQGVCLEIEDRHTTYIATDGHRVIAYRDELGDDEPSNTLLGVHIVPTPYCTIIKLEKDDQGRGRLFGGMRLTIAHSLLEFTFVAIEGNYLDWRKSIPKTKASGVVAQFNLKHMADLLKICKQLDLGQPFIAPNGSDAPAFIWFNAKHVFGAIMPVKAIDQMNRNAPVWARRGPQRDQGDIEDLVLLPYDDEQVDDETGEVTKKGPPKLLPPPHSDPDSPDSPTAH